MVRGGDPMPGRHFGFQLSRLSDAYLVKEVEVARPGCQILI